MLESNDYFRVIYEIHNLNNKFITTAFYCISENQNLHFKRKNFK